MRTIQNFVDERKSFAKSKPVMKVPDLLDIQIKSFEDFLQKDVPPDKRKIQGLEEAFRTVFPIEDNHGNYLLEYKYYTVGDPPYTVWESIERGVTYAVPLKVRLVLHISEEGGSGKYTAGIEQDIFFGNIPYMTDRGTFVINGAERVIVSQLQRSPGVFFDQQDHSSGNKIYISRVIPFRGSWVDFVIDHNDIMHAIIDKRRKFPATILLRAFGYPKNEDILALFDMGKRVNIKNAEKEANGKFLAENIVDPETGEVIIDIKNRVKVDEEVIKICKNHNIESLLVFATDDETIINVFLNTFIKDPIFNDEEEAVYFLYRNLRTGEPPNLDVARKFVERLFFSPKRYDLGMVGRYRINKKFNLKIPIEETVLTKQDLVEIMRYLVKMKRGEIGVDDIDHLGNRRVRTVGEQLTNQFTLALTRMARTVRERMNLRESENLTPQDLVNSRIITSAINSFFGTNQLSQFMDQTNPLAETTHKRRVSALGPGGLSRERAGFEVRDVHYTHYGRLCPIETPEGPNIGLISSLATYAYVNELGFIETPYRKVFIENGKARVTNEIEYLSADDEDRELIAQANAPVDEKGYFKASRVRARIKGEFPIVDPKEVKYMDVSPQQIVSVSASLIPFLEHDDANRALMGSNMQRQSVPLLIPERPIVGTGMEKKVAVDSKAVVTSPIDGVVEKVSANYIIIRNEEFKDELNLDETKERIRIDLVKFQRTNQDTTINQRPLVKPGQKVKKGDVIADGCSTDKGELALGRNVLVAFMPWRGYNFEDAIVISERLLKDDVFTSVHIKEFELEVRDTKRGPEELTREIPNISEEKTANLDPNGIIRVGAEVQPGDILIGKVVPKGETDPTPEEKLLRAIFGEKAADVKDASKKADPGVWGVVINTKLFSRKGKESRIKDRKKIEEITNSGLLRQAELKKRRNAKLIEILKGKIANEIKDITNRNVVVKDGTVFDDELLKNLDFDKLALNVDWTKDEETNKKIKTLFDNYFKVSQKIDDDIEKEIYKIKVGDDLQPGVLQLAKVYVATKRKIRVGDKVAGRHGNKGVVSIVVPEEDMPFLEDGTRVDMILNPLGVPSRMNLGQLYETMLGWAGKKLGIHYETPVFNGATHDEVIAELKKAGLPEDCKVTLYDGKTGEPYENKVMVGYIYMMKLLHLVEDKVHARATGPYSLITQQPLGGKAQFGGQRLGEMEVWALEAYGAAYTLQEMLTVKSDDVDGRTKMYNAIVNGENFSDFGMPESFNVLVKELQGLCIELDLNYTDEEE
ncbi:MAG: DNA-directed RNA polymerase subunit beta [Candidatus Marinimicrobia bacterium]|nr:DNA-directed RNA polymerase subunit beta [Candidatus Neomarinimicrobiota bacterium]